MDRRPDPSSCGLPRTRIIVFLRRVVLYLYGEEPTPDMELFSGGQLEEVTDVDSQPCGRYTIHFVDGTLAFDVPHDSFKFAVEAA